MTLVALTGIDGTTYRVNPLSVARLQTIPNTLNSYVDLLDPSLARIAVVGDVATVKTALEATGEVSFAGLTDLNGAVEGVNPAAVSAIYPVNGGQTYVDYLDPSIGRVAYSGSVAAVATALDAALPANRPASGNFAPILSASGGGVVAAVGPWRYLQIAKRIIVVGKLAFTPAVAGVLETITGNCPVSPGAFAAASDLTGLVSDEEGGAATAAIVTNPAAQAGFAAWVIDITATGAQSVGVCLQYVAA